MVEASRDLIEKSEGAPSEPPRMHMAQHVSRAIRTVIPQAALALFSSAEFQLMINGVDELSAETVWQGVHFKHETPLKNRLKNISLTENENFRFAFNRFVTAVAQPPISRDNDPWIFAEVDSLESAKSSNLLQKYG